MDNVNFQQLLAQFQAVDTNEKINLYVTAEGLSQEQYKELLRFYPYNEIDKLEAALR